MLDFQYLSNELQAMIYYSNSKENFPTLRHQKNWDLAPISNTILTPRAWYINILQLSHVFITHFIALGSSSDRFQYGISTSDSAETHNHQLTDNATINIIISRISLAAEDSPVSSRLLISPATETHNGTEVTYEDVSLSVTESTTIIIYINGQIQGMHNNNNYYRNLHIVIE